MTQHSLKYPNRADTLALFKAREKGDAPARSSSAANGAGGSSRTDELVVCMGVVVCAPR